MPLASQFTRTPRQNTEPMASTRPKVKASSAGTRLRGIGRIAVRLMMAVDIGVVPHVERARRARAERDEDEGGESDQRMHRAGRGNHGGKCREDGQRHDPRLQQREIIPEGRPGSRLRRLAMLAWHWR